MGQAASDLRRPARGGLLDYTFYREMIPDRPLPASIRRPRPWPGPSRPRCGYYSGLLVAVYRLGAGEFVLNTLLIRENLGRHPAAERLLRNMVNYAAKR